MLISTKKVRAKTQAFIGRTSGFALGLALLVPLVVTSPAAAQPFAYVVGQRDPAGSTAVVSVIDTAANQRVTTIPVDKNCVCVDPASIVVVPDLGRVYVTNEIANSVSVIDIASNSVIADVAVGTGPTAIAAKANGSRVYVLNGTFLTSVYAIDTATNTVVGSAALGVSQARGMAITPDGERLYVTTYGSNSVIVIATASMTILATIPVAGLPIGIDVTPDGSRAYVAASAANTVHAIDTATNTVLASIPVGTGPQTARVTPDGTRVYVPNSASDSVSVISTQTNAVLGTVAGVSQPKALDVTPDGSRVFVASSSSVAIIDVATSTLTASTIEFAASTEGHPAAIAIGRAIGGNAPTAVNNGYVTLSNQVLTVPASGIIANDNANGGGTMTAVLVNNVAHGTLLLESTGGFTYHPAFNFAGTDTFTYRAINDVGASNLATVSLRVVGGVQPPSGLYASAIVGNTVTLRWLPPDAGDAPTGYVLEGGVHPGEVLASFATHSDAPTFTFVAPTGAFYVRVHTLSGGNRSIASNEIRIFVNVPAPPSAPANLLGLVSGSNLSLAWRNTFEGGAPTSLLLDVSGTVNGTLPLPTAETFNFVDVPPGTYTLRLRAANASGISAPSNPVMLTFPGACTGVPQAPTNLVAAKDNGGITVLWERATSGPAATGFLLNVTGSFVGSFPTTQRTLSGAVGPGTYNITVHATNACGVSAPSAQRTVVIP